MSIQIGRTDATRILIQKILIQDSSVQKPDYLTDAFFTYWDECKNEIEGEEIGNGSTSCFDLFKADDNKIVICMINDKIKKAIHTRTPIFGEQLNSKFKKGMER